MSIEPVHDADWPLLRQWMEAEGWRLPEWEETLFRENPAAQAFVLRQGGEALLGCVTIMTYPRSGWIGNLLVPPPARGFGFGRQLFQHALDQLQDRERIWLTASNSGAPLYRQYGFTACGSIVRWRRRGTGTTGVTTAPLLPLLTADAACWGDDRSALLGYLAACGTLLRSGSTAALLQPGARLRVLGPWYSGNLCPRECRDLLAAALEQTPVDAELVTDLPAGSPVAPLLQAIGFVRGGDNTLMLRGEPHPLPAHFALASLGSVG